MGDSSEFSHAFAVSRMNFYSLAKRTFFSRNLICLHHACVQLFRAKIFAFREEKTLVESGLNGDTLSPTAHDLLNNQLTTITNDSVIIDIEEFESSQTCSEFGA